MTGKFSGAAASGARFRGALRPGPTRPSSFKKQADLLASEIGVVILAASLSVAAIFTLWLNAPP